MCFSNVSLEQSKVLDRAILLLERDQQESTKEVIQHAQCFTQEQKAIILQRFQTVGLQAIRNEIQTVPSWNSTQKQEILLGVQGPDLFTQLPGEILLKIFNELKPSLKQVSEWGLLCKRLHNVFKDSMFWGVLGYDQATLLRRNIKDQKYACHEFLDPTLMADHIFNLLHPIGWHIRAHNDVEVVAVYEHKGLVFSSCEKGSFKIWNAQDHSLIKEYRFPCHDGLPFASRRYVFQIAGYGNFVFAFSTTRASDQVRVHRMNATTLGWEHFGGAKCSDIKAWILASNTFHMNGNFNEGSFSIGKRVIKNDRLAIHKNFVLVETEKDQMINYNLETGKQNVLSKQEQEEECKVMEASEQCVEHPFSYSYLNDNKRPLDLKNQCFLIIKDSKTNTSLIKIFIGHFKFIVGNPKISCFHVSKGLVYVGFSDGSLKKIDFLLGQVK